jgi:hypothetical protein
VAIPKTCAIGAKILTDQYFILDTQTGYIFFRSGLPFLTEDATFGQFVTWALNKHAASDRYKLKKFLGLEMPDSRLAVPYLSQWGAGADQRPGDCGPACIAMITAYLTAKRPTVDEAAAACGQPPAGEGAKYTNHAQLRQGARAFGFTLESRSKYTPPPLTLELLKSQVDKGRPSIALIHYGELRDRTNPISGIIHNQDQNYARGHWITFTGYDQKGVYIHDPDFWQDRSNDGNARFIPTAAFAAALAATAPGCSVGYQGLIATDSAK